MCALPSEAGIVVPHLTNKLWGDGRCSTPSYDISRLPKRKRKSLILSKDRKGSCLPVLLEHPLDHSPCPAGHPRGHVDGPLQGLRVGNVRHRTLGGGLVPEKEQTKGEANRRTLQRGKHHVFRTAKAANTYNIENPKCHEACKAVLAATECKGMPVS